MDLSFWFYKLRRIETLPLEETWLGWYIFWKVNGFWMYFCAVIIFSNVFYVFQIIYSVSYILHKILGINCYIL